MRIYVNQSHISRGKCRSAQRCMIAEAIRDMTEGEAEYIAVRANAITVSYSLEDGTKIRQHWAVPLKAVTAIRDFDEGKAIKPFSFASKLIEEIKVPVKDQISTRKSVKRAAERRKAAKAAGDPVAMEPRRKPTARPRYVGV